jgi:hypothetical protein
MFWVAALAERGSSPPRRAATADALVSLLTAYSADDQAGKPSCPHRQWRLGSP